MTLVNTNATFIAYILGTLLPASYTYSYTSIYPVPIPIDFGRSYTCCSSSPTKYIACLVYDREDLTLNTIIIVLEGEDKEEEVVE